MGNKQGNSFIFSHPSYMPTSPINRASWLHFFLTLKLESKQTKKKRERNSVEILRELREVSGEELEEEASYQRRNYSYYSARIKVKRSPITFKFLNLYSRLIRIMFVRIHRFEDGFERIKATRS